jgi:hypothetical protein
MATYEQPEYDTPKGSAIDSILEGDEVMLFWFPSETEPGCWAFKTSWEDWTPQFFPTLEYRQADDLRTLTYHWANDHYACVGSKRELDYWLAEARRRERKEAAAA